MKQHNSFRNDVDLTIKLWYTKYVVSCTAQKGTDYEF